MPGLLHSDGVDFNSESESANITRFIACDLVLLTLLAQMIATQGF